MQISCYPLGTVYSMNNLTILHMKHITNDVWGKKEGSRTLNIVIIQQHGTAWISSLLLPAQCLSTRVCGFIMAWRPPFHWTCTRFSPGLFKIASPQLTCAAVFSPCCLRSAVWAAGLAMPAGRRASLPSHLLPPRLPCPPAGPLRPWPAWIRGPYPEHRVSPPGSRHRALIKKSPSKALFLHVPKGRAGHGRSLWYRWHLCPGIMGRRFTSLFCPLRTNKHAVICPLNLCMLNVICMNYAPDCALTKTVDILHLLIPPLL